MLSIPPPARAGTPFVPLVAPWWMKPVTIMARKAVSHIGRFRSSAASHPAGWSPCSWDRATIHAMPKASPSTKSTFVQKIGIMISPDADAEEPVGAAAAGSAKAQIALRAVQQDVTHFMALHYTRWQAHTQAGHRPEARRSPPDGIALHLIPGACLTSAPFNGLSAKQWRLVLRRASSGTRPGSCTPRPSESLR